MQRGRIRRWRSIAAVTVTLGLAGCAMPVLTHDGQLVFQPKGAHGASVMSPPITTVPVRSLTTIRAARSRRRRRRRPVRLRQSNSPSTPLAPPGLDAGRRWPAAARRTRIPRRRPSGPASLASGVASASGSSPASSPEPPPPSASTCDGAGDEPKPRSTASRSAKTPTSRRAPPRDVSDFMGGLFSSWIAAIAPTTPGASCVETPDTANAS